MGKRKNLSKAFNEKHASNTKQKKFGTQLSNPFEVRDNKKLKHDVLNRKLKGAKRNVALARSMAHEKRKKTLLNDYVHSRKTNQFQDARFGEKNSKLSEEEKVLERFKRLRSKKNLYDLSDTDRAKGNDSMGFTHLGQSLNLEDANGRGDMQEFEEMLKKEGLLGQDQDDEEEDVKLDMAELMERMKETGDNEDRSKTKKEVMEEIIAKAKMFKMQRQREREEDEEERERLDDMFKDLMQGGMFHMRPTKKEKKEKELKKMMAKLEKKKNGEQEEDDKKDDDDDEEEEEEEDEYDQIVRGLTFEARAAATDRSMTAEEIARRDLEKLEQQQRELEKRMKGYLSDEDDEDGRRGGKKRKRRQSKDEFDMMEEEEEDDYDDDDDDDDDDDEGESDDDESIDSLEREDNKRAKKKAKVTDVVSSKLAKRARVIDEAKGELPYIIDVPDSHVDFVQYLENYPDSSLKTIIERITKANSIHLLAENRAKMGRFMTILLNHLFFVKSSEDRLSCLKGLYDVAHHVGNDAVKVFCDRLNRMQMTLGVHLSNASQEENGGDDFGSAYTYKGKPGQLYSKKKGGHKGAKGRSQVAAESLEEQEELEILDNGVDLSDSRCWPSRSDLLFFRALEAIFPVTDFRHVVVSPAQLLLGQYLAQCPLRGPKDVAACICTCQLLLDYCRDAKRVSPEVLITLEGLLNQLSLEKVGENRNYLCSQLVKMDMVSAQLSFLANKTKKTTRKSKKKSVELLESLCYDAKKTCDAEQILQGVLGLCDQLVDVVQDSPSCDTLLSGIAQKLDKFEGNEDLKEKVAGAISRAMKSRKPMRLLESEARAIQSIAPLFNENYRWTKDGHDPDKVRAEMKKLKRQVHREKKGVARELRKDAQFIAEQRDQEKQAKYNQLRAERQRNFDLLQNMHGEMSKAVRLGGAKGGGSSGADMRGRRKKKSKQ